MPKGNSLAKKFRRSRPVFLLIYESKLLHNESNKQPSNILGARTMQPKNAHDHNAPKQSWNRDVCFGCGPANPIGLQLNFALTPSGASYICEFQLGGNFAGPPGHAHGGIIATILDE